MSEAAGNFDFMELGQAIMDAREKQRITREELAEELGISARHLQAVEKEGQNPSFPLFIQLVTMFHISVDQYIHPDFPTGYFRCQHPNMSAIQRLFSFAVVRQIYNTDILHN